MNGCINDRDEVFLEAFLSKETIFLLLRGYCVVFICFRSEHAAQHAGGLDIHRDQPP